MNAIVYIALAVPFVGFLTRHLLVTRDQFNEALRSGKPSPANRALIGNGVLFTALGVIIALLLVKQWSDWPIILASMLIFFEGVWDLWHGVKLSRIRQTPSPEDETGEPEQSAALVRETRGRSRAGEP